jgi:pimeloyl-ACP methyl ester carboxylesterase
VQRVNTDGVGLAVHEWPGRGPAIVAVHGLTSNHTVWYPIADALDGRRRLLAYDLRGRGDSDKPARL